MPESDAESECVTDVAKNYFMWFTVQRPLHSTRFWDDILYMILPEFTQAITYMYQNRRLYYKKEVNWLPKKINITNKRMSQ